MTAIVDINVIPPITDPLGRGWRQPPSDQILIDDEHALMPFEVFNKLANYSRSTPSGVYPGKMWKCNRPEGGPVWWLRWYGLEDGHPDGLPTPSRKIIVVEKTVIEPLKYATY